MNRRTLVLRGLAFHARTHLGVALGCAVSAAVLAGALFVGDSVRESLRRIALARLGRIEVGLETGPRYFRAALADGLPGAAPGLRLGGMAIVGERQVNRVEVTGVDARFFALADSPAPAPGRDDVLISEKLAAALGVRAGDEISIRVHKPGLLARDAPLASRKKDDRDFRRGLFKVRAVLGAAQLGRFSLRSNQDPPAAAFVNLAWLQETVDLEGRANLLVSSDPAAAAALRGKWTLEDAGIAVRSRAGVVQVESPRIYLDAEAARAASGLRPGAASSVSYLVNEIASEDGKSTPYSFVTALSPGPLGPVPEGMRDDEIVVNRWLADRLALRPGSRVRVAYSEFSASDEFLPRNRSFTVRSIVEMAALENEKELVPRFPGLTDVDSCQDWEIGLPMEDAKLKDKDNEKYWDDYKQTPKAFVTFAAGAGLWSNRYGSVMAVRFREGDGDVAGDLRARLDPVAAGLAFRPVRGQALRAVSESMDLGQLFLGMSFFLIVASLLLTAMLFVFSVEQRAREMGVLLAVGLTARQVRLLFLAEGAALAIVGSLAGLLPGWAFARALIAGLGGAWQGAVAGTPVAFHATATSAATAAFAAALMSLGTMAFAARRQSLRPVRELVADDVSVVDGGSGRPRLQRLLLAAGVAGAVLVAAAGLASANPAPSFFGAGALMLVAGLAGLRMLLARLSAASSARVSVAALGVRNAARRPGRSLATAGMLACGCFIVLSVSAMKEDLSRQAGERRSGTGGFALYGESSYAMKEDLSTPKGRAALRIEEGGPMEGVRILPLRMREGDDASCLNLNQAPAPTLVGVDPARMAGLGAFGGPELWGLLDAPPEGAVPAIVGDSATAVWKLKRRIGEVFDYDDGRGTKFPVRLVGALAMRLSVLQGRLLIPNRDFTRLFPSEGGHRLFLVDAPKAAEAAAYLSRKLEAAGVDFVPPVERLRAFYEVESAYLALFVVLGGLGLLLGTAGTGVLVLRNVLERRSELALLRAVGCTPVQAAGVVLAEQRFLVAAGLAAGTAAAALAVGPAASRVPFGLLALLLLGTLAFSFLWIWAAARWALRAPLVPALRNE